MRRIKQAAIVFQNGKMYVGKRHSDCFLAAFEAGEPSPRYEIQGFVTDDGEFVNRRDAAVIAFAAGQITEATTRLFSEDLY